MARSTVQYDGTDFDYVGGAITSFPGGGGGGTYLDYASSSSTLTVTATTAATAQTAVTGASISLDGSTRVCVAFFCPLAQVDTRGVGTGGSILRIELYDGSTDLGMIAVYTSLPESTTVEQLTQSPIYGAVVLTPSNGSHQFIAKAWKNASGAIAGLFPGSGGAGVAYPMFLSVAAC